MSTETKNVRTCTLLLSSAAPCECEMAYSIFANGKDPLSSVSTAISNKEDSFESANEHWSRFAAVCNLKSRNAENIRLTLTAYGIEPKSCLKQVGKFSFRGIIEFRSSFILLSHRARGKRKFPTAGQRNFSKFCKF